MGPLKLLLITIKSSFLLQAASERETLCGTKTPVLQNHKENDFFYFAVNIQLHPPPLRSRGGYFLSGELYHFFDSAHKCPWQKSNINRTASVYTLLVIQIDTD